MARGSCCLAVALLVTWTLESACALSCVCNKQRCTRLENCPAGRVPDACGCCLECGRTLNQSCGGLHALEGACGSGLYCELDVEFGSRIGAAQTSGAVGVCRECKGRREFGCLIFDNECECGYSCTRQFQHATKAACDKALFGNSGQNCSRVACPSSEPCPPDSYRPPAKQLSSGCCKQTQQCVCRQSVGAEGTCPGAPVCASSELPVLVLPGTGLPGSCCPLYRCTHRSILQCHQGNATFSNGDSVPGTACQNCTCKDGSIYCKPSDCPESQSLAVSSCGWLALSNNGCCLVCKGCVSPSTSRLYATGSSWQESDCLTCECDTNGISHCYTSRTCDVACLNPRRVTGQCCPVCDTAGYPIDVQVTEAASKPATSAFPSLCDNASTAASCNLQCAHGLMMDNNGCIKCQCNLCPVLDCHGSDLDCTSSGNVLATDQWGCPTCKCLRGHGTGNAVTGGNNMSAVCFTSRGRSYSNGDSWFDGCRQCYCFAGQERCTLIYCPSLQCSQPVLHPGACCPSCSEVATAVAFPDVGFPSICSPDTISRQSGARDEVWWLDACTSCLCYRGQALCESQPCAPALCERPYLQPGACCPTCPGVATEQGTTATTAAWLPGRDWPADSYRRRGCSSPRAGNESARATKAATTTTYEHGEVWRVNECQVCTCQDGVLRCYTQSCNTAAACRGSTAILKKGHCCPECTADSWTCVINSSHVVPHGAIWIDKCMQCSCRKGSIACIPGPCDAQQACRSGEHNCCQHCSGHFFGETVQLVSPLMIGLLTLLSVFGVVIVVLVVIVVRRARHRGNTLTAIPKILEMRAFNNSTSVSIPAEVARKPLMEKRPKSTNLEFLSVSTAHFTGVPPSKDTECIKPLMDNSRNEYIHC